MRDPPEFPRILNTSNVFAWTHSNGDEPFLFHAIWVWNAGAAGYWIAFYFIRHTFLLLILFLIPGIVMMVAYGLISLELYQGIKFDASQKKSARGNYLLAVTKACFL